jgi:hypothetical protein
MALIGLDLADSPNAIGAPVDQRKRGWDTMNADPYVLDLHSQILRINGPIPPSPCRW